MVKTIKEYEEELFLSNLMEEIAKLPKEELGKRQPGEKGMYERQRIENDRLQ